MLTINPQGKASGLMASNSQGAVMKKVSGICISAQNLNMTLSLQSLMRTLIATMATTGIVKTACAQPLTLTFNSTQPTTDMKNILHGLAELATLILIFAALFVAFNLLTP